MSVSYLISVVVCTYNRSELLSLCLDPLCQQTILSRGNYYEVIVVDNNSTDSTQQVVQKYIDKYPFVRITHEARQGLSHSRNRGWEEANGEYVAYIDDDAKAFLNWIESIVSFIKKYPAISAFGGPYFSYSNIPVPDWFPAEYGSMSLGENCKKLRQTEWISGTNMIYKKTLLRQLGGFDIAHGMTGDVMAYGEEIELLQRVKDNAMPIYYDPYICVYHLIMPHKLTLYFLLKSSCISSLEANKVFTRPLSRLRKLFNFILVCITSGYTFIVCDEKYLKSRLYRALQPVACTLGGLLATFGKNDAAKR